MQDLIENFGLKVYFVLYGATQKMLELNLPKTELRLENREGRPHIWDKLRKKWLVLTPEEYVRQHFVAYLVSEGQYPPSLISLERAVSNGKLLRRTDIVVYDPKRQPLLLVECKAPFVQIGLETLEQASAYNYVLQAPYLALTNGIQHLYFEIDFEARRSKQLASLPKFRA